LRADPLWRGAEPVRARDARGEAVPRRVAVVGSPLRRGGVLHPRKRMSLRPIAYEYREGNALLPRAGDKGETGWRNCARPGACWAGFERFPSCNTDRGVPRLGESGAMKLLGAGKPNPPPQSCLRAKLFQWSRQALWGDERSI